MGRFELEQEQWEVRCWAERYDAQVGEHNALAAAAEGELGHKNDQLARARNAKECCAQVCSSQEDFSRDLEAFAAAVSTAMQAPALQRALASLKRGANDHARSALSAAERLVQALEDECASLRDSIENHRAEADYSAEQARECWDTVEWYQNEIDNCEE